MDPRQEPQGGHDSPTDASRSRTDRREVLWSRYARFLSTPPESVFEWNDPVTGARGWLVQNSLRGGASGGGTRMRPGLDRAEVEYLAKVMELKFSVSGPAIGGAKAGLDFDPSDPRKAEVLRRWFEQIRPIMRTRFGTAGDLNVDAAREVAPLSRAVGLRHPQEGVARGHFGLTGEALERRLHAMDVGLQREVEGELGLAGSGLQVGDLVTGYGVATATLRLLERAGRAPSETRVLVEGVGSVGGGAALYLARAGARIVGLRDIEGGRVSEGGFRTDEVERLLRGRTGGLLPRDVPAGRTLRDAERFHEVEADVFVCAASSGTVDPPALERLADQGVDTLVCGANRPFVADHPGDVTVERDADRRLAVLADVVTNCGAARAISYQMSREEPAAPAAIFEAVGATVRESVDEVVERAGRSDSHLLASALEMTLERVEREREERPAVGDGAALGKAPA